MLECQAPLFSLPQDIHYLNAAYMGPLAKSTEQAGVEAVRLKSTPYTLTPADFFSGTNMLRERFGRLINAESRRVALVPSVSYGVAIAGHNITLARGQNVVIPAEEFPSNVHMWRDACAGVGADFRMVPRPTDVQRPAREWSARIMEAIDDQTAVVTLTLVHWTDGTPFDLAAIARRAREVGAYLILDGTQSIGAVPFDFGIIQPDLLVCASYKWLLGPYQYGFAVLGDRLLEGRPFERTWIGREGSENFAGLVNYTDGYQPGARRFDVGENSNWVSVAMLNESLRLIEGWGVERIAGYIEGLLVALRAELEGVPGLHLPPRDDQAPHMLGIRLPDAARVPQVLEALAARKVYASQRGTSLRVSPHVYNSTANMHALATTLREVLG